MIWLKMKIHKKQQKNKDGETTDTTKAEDGETRLI